MTKEEIAVISRELSGVLEQGIVGDVVELGCYEGTCALFMQQILSRHAPERKLHVYDSFEGLPQKTHWDASVAGEQFRAGELRASKSRLIRNFRQANLAIPVIHQGWFADLTTRDIPTQIAFAFLDGDFYESIKTSFALITSQMAPGGTIIVDDYQAPALPGATKAVNEWLKDHFHASIRHEQTLAIIHV